ncbi:MAG: tyrosine--tRNA ligase, partial [Pseudomonadota bacterium]
MNHIETLKKRGYVYQISDEKAVSDILQNPKGKTFYVGFDPTADSLHLGSMFVLMAISRVAQTGLKPIIVMGGGTGLVGDPSGKTEMRTLLDEDVAKKNLKNMEAQIRKILPKDPAPLFVNNLDWIAPLNYIQFLRDVGKNFSINRMLTQDCVKDRLEKGGLTYLEFSYMLLQSYDFVYLNKHHNCVLQLGGADQWGNMIMGIDLARKMNNSDVQCFTFELMMTASGGKMGKTEKGTVWLDPEKTSPYEYYQYWINVDDRDVKKFFYCYTYMPDDEIEKVLKTLDIRELKKLLAFETTKILHGEKEAVKAREASAALFGGDSSKIEGVPVFNMESAKIKSGMNIVDFLVETKLVSSKGEARRLIQGGGAYVNDEKVSGLDQTVLSSDVKNGV